MMLDPSARSLLLDALRPPPGHVLELAVGTTFTLDLLALMTAPVAFAFFDRQSGDGSAVVDPIATLQALREHAVRITLFCQAGQIAVPREYRSLLVYLEDSIYPVVPPQAEKIFHPKVWFIRYRHSERDDLAYRMLCLSRNLTFDRSWDTILRLNGVPGDEERWPELSRFARSLVAMARGTRPLATERAAAIHELGDQIARVTWTPPENLELVRFWPLGHDGVERWPFDGRRDRMLVVSPFVTAGAIKRLTHGRNNRGSILVSRPETFDALGGDATAHLGERLVLAADASTPGDSEAEVESGQTESVAESADHRLVGLHAKAYIADAGWKARVWTGSANATDAAFHGNVEFVVELTGRRDRVGVDAVIGDQPQGQGLRMLVEPYTPAQDEPLEPSDAEQIEMQLDRARRAIGGLRFTASCAARDNDLWQLSLSGAATTTQLDWDLLSDIVVKVRPVTLGREAEDMPTLGADGLRVRFVVSEQAITPYFAVTLAIGDIEVAFLVAAELENAPPGRAEHVLRDLLSNRADLLRFLLLLLGNIDDAQAAFETGDSGGPANGRWLSALGLEALLEPLVRAYAREPRRLRDIERVLVELGRVDGSASILPERWSEIWDPIAMALAEDAAL